MSTESDLNLITLHDINGQEIDVDTIGLIGMKLVIPAPSYRTITEEIEGRDGILVIDRVLNSRSMTAEFISKADDYIDSLELRDRLYELLGNGKEFYVSENKNPSRRWKVYLEGWDPIRLNLIYHKFEVPLFVSSGSSESISVINKKFTTSTFRFRNEGSVGIDPRKDSETEITFKGVSTNLVIRNKTTGDSWALNGNTTISDTILLKGVRFLKNGVSVLGQSNKKLITIAPGWNDFEIVGATGVFELTIRTRFYFL